jgi:phospholipid/cholesterol/gamma-HCH transport system substrate-binding protein
MYASWQTKLIVGIFAILGIVALAYLSLSLGRISLFPTDSYTLYANFDNISGLKTGDQVEIAGVQVGKVIAISLKNYRAHVALQLNDGVNVDSQAIASIKTSGIIGDKYVSISLGAGHNLGNDGVIRHTESAFVLEDAIGQLINSSSSSPSSPSSSSSGGAPATGKSSSQGSIQ